MTPTLTLTPTCSYDPITTFSFVILNQVFNVMSFLQFLVFPQLLARAISCKVRSMDFGRVLFQ